ncbi:MAG: hypothetical protein M1840_009073 [Geoglossum simile]|nr:MAG: hypothetical protein M1840_009073 [Geoglossum simile]
MLDLRMVGARAGEDTEDSMEEGGGFAAEGGETEYYSCSGIGSEQLETSTLDIQLEEEADWDTEPPPSFTALDSPTTLEQATTSPHIETAHLSPSAAIPVGPRGWDSRPSSQQPTRVQSRQWRSPIGLETDRFLTIQVALERIAPQSPFVPVTLHDWLSHRLGWLEDQTQAAEEQLVLLLQHNKSPRKRTAAAPAALAGRSFSSNHSAVLSQETIWSPWNPRRACAPWPSSGEYRWEGDARARSGFHRFPPIPRARSNDTVVWHQKPAADVYEFDRVGSSARLPYREFGEEEGPLRPFLEEGLWHGIALEQISAS